MDTKKVIQMIREKMEEHYSLPFSYIITSFEGVYNLNANVYPYQNIQPVTIIEIPANLSDKKALEELFFKKGVNASIVMGGQFVIPQADGGEHLLQDSVLQEKYIIVMHELYHVAITDNPAIFPYVSDINNRIDNVTNNIVQDFIIDTVGTPLLHETSILSSATRGFELDKWHYFNLLKGGDGYISQLSRYLYGYALEKDKSNEYEFPHIEGMSDDTYKLLVKAFDSLRKSIAELKVEVENGNREDYRFWTYPNLFTAGDKNPIIRSLAKIFHDFSIDLRKVDEKMQKDGKSLKEAMGNSSGAQQQNKGGQRSRGSSTGSGRSSKGKATRQESEGQSNQQDSKQQEGNGAGEASRGQNVPSSETSEGEKGKGGTEQNEKKSIDDILKEIYNNGDDVVFVDDKGNVIPENKIKDIIADLRDIMSEIRPSGFAPGGAKSGGGIPRVYEDRYNPDLRKKADSIIRSYINVKLTSYINNANLYGNKVLMAIQSGTSGKVNIKRTIKMYPELLHSHPGHQPPVYDKYQMSPLPKTKILAVCDVSGSMDSLNRTLKPFLSMLYREGLNALFHIGIADFSDSVVKEPDVSTSVSKDTYYAGIIRNGIEEGGTDPLNPSNLKAWEQIVTEERPDLIIVYTDLGFASVSTPEEAKKEMTEMFRKFGVSPDKVVFVNVGDQMFRDIHNDEELMEKVAGITMNYILQKFQNRVSTLHSVER